MGVVTKRDFQVYAFCGGCEGYFRADHDGKIAVGGVCPTCGAHREDRAKVIARRVDTSVSVWWKPKTWWKVESFYEYAGEYLGTKEGWE